MGFCVLQRNHSRFLRRLFDIGSLILVRGKGARKKGGAAIAWSISCLLILMRIGVIIGPILNQCKGFIDIQLLYLLTEYESAAAHLAEHLTGVRV